MDDVGKWRDDVRTRTLGKQWTEYARHAWDISPTLAVFLPTWLNNSPVLVSEVSRLVRAAPTKVIFKSFLCDISLSRCATYHRL